MTAVLLLVAEEAPSSISSGDQVRAALVLGACLLAMALLAALAVRQARRRNRSTRTGQDQGAPGPPVHPGSDGDLKPDQNGSATPRPGR